MELKLGERLRALRRRDGRTQDDLAQALEVTPQAVSRWENGSCYPDMALIPAIANYFGVTIDALFGYQNGREEKIDAILAKLDAFHIKSRGDDQWVEECLGLLRAGLAEFPQNERLRLALADTLTQAGWRRYHEWLYYDGEGCLQHDRARHRENPFWAEAVELCEALADTSGGHAVAAQALTLLVLLYRNLGEADKAAACARRMPGLESCREVLLASAADGKEGAVYAGDLLMKLASTFAQQLVYALMAKQSHFQSDMPIEKLKGAIALLTLVCDDGNLGEYHDQLISLCLYLSRLQWERGYHDDAFASLDEALGHARALEALADGREHFLTAPLVAGVRCRAIPAGGIAGTLPEDWPFWQMPDYSKTAAEIKADPRWNAWVRRCGAE